MSQQLQITGGAKVRSLEGVITGTTGVLNSLPINGSLGIPQLDVNGKILVSQLPNSVMEYLGTWDASTNTPTLVNGTGNAGDVYLCNVAGTVNFGAGPISFVVSDQVIYSGSIWQKASGTSGTVTSVAASITGNSLGITGSPITTAGTLAFAFAGTNLQYVNGAGNLTTFPTLISSIGLSMPSAFSVSNSPLTANGTIAVTGAGYPSQYIRGDGTLADFPTSGGGGSSVSYYLNGGTSQGVIGGTTYYEMSKTAVIGTGVDFPLVGNGLIVAFLTDAGDPAQLNIPAGNWNYEIYASMSANGGTPQMYAELYKYDGTTFTLIATSSNEILYDGVNLNLYTFAMAVPATSLFLSDRLAVLLYATNSGGKTTTVHTQDSHLCQVITTFSTGITALNNLTAQVQYFATGTSGSDFNISSSTATHTFNLPTASASNRGALSTADWSTFNGKQNAITLTTTGSSGASTFISNTLNIPTYTLSGLGGVPTSRTLTINGVGYDLSADRSWTVSSMIYPSAGIAVSTGTAWGTSITDNSADWNTAYTNRITSATLPLSITSNVISITDASASTSGVITTGTQTIAGAKTFSSNITMSSNTLTSTGATGFTIKTTTVGAWTALYGDTGGLYLGTNAGNWMFINNSGNVGIGNITPSYKLDVTGTGRFTSNIEINSSAANLVALTMSANSTGGVRQRFLNQAGSGVYNFQIGSNITTNNAFEIIPSTAADGTTFSTAVFKILNTGAATFSSLSGTGNRIVGADSTGLLSSITVGAGLSLTAGVLIATGGSSGTVTVTAGALNSQVPYFTSATNIAGSSNHVWDNTNARLGIGTSSPAYKLDVNGTGRFTGALRVESNSEIIGGSGGSDWLRLTRTGVSQWAFNSNGTGLSFINNTSVVTALTLASTGAATFSGDLTINGTNKNVQLGSSTLPTTSSNLRHYFAGAATFVGQDGVGEANVGNNFYYNAAFLRRNTDYASNIRFDAGNIYLQVAASGAANSAITWTNALTIASTGNVLIGTTTDATGKLQVNGTVYATAYYETSDIRLKNVIETNPKVNVSGIDVIKFTRTDNDTEQVRYGYSAQQVQTILPDVVTGQEYLNVNYTDIHTLKIAALELEIAELKELIKSLIK